MIGEHFVIKEFVTAFYTEDPEGRRIYFSNRRSACFILPVRGQISFSGEKGRVIADAAHPVFLPMGFSYLNECLADAASYVFNFKTEESYEHPCELNPISENVIRAFYEKIRQAECATSLQSSLLILETLYALAGYLFQEKSAERTHDAVSEALAYMRKHYAQSSLTIVEIARASHVSEIYLRKLFARELALTPFKALTDIRMQRARLLIEEKRPLKEVAASVGYADVFQFSRAYKRYFGFPPSHIKKNRA